MIKQFYIFIDDCGYINLLFEMGGEYMEDKIKLTLWQITLPKLH